MVALAAVVVFGFYLMAIPVKLALVFESGVGFRAGVGIFAGKFAQNAAKRPQKARKSMKKSPKKAQKSRKKPQLRDIPALFAGAKYLLAHARLDAFSVSGQIGCADAAATAILCGVIGSAVCCARVCTGADVRGGVQPDFFGGHTRMQAVGIVSIRAGHIILAALIAGSRRVKKWKSIRLKTS